MEEISKKRRIDPLNPATENEIEASKKPRILDTLERNALERRQNQTGVSRIPLPGKSIMVTAPNGERVWVAERKADASSLPDVENMRLLSLPVRTLLDDIDHKNYMNTLRESEVAENEENIHQSVRLWVDKYAPTKYRELLSEEKTNRQLMQWLRLWITPQENKQASKQSVLAQKTRENEYSKQNKWSGCNDPFAVGQDGRPLLKVVMISGPPGTGKTTLAHVAATAAGFRPVEINASDDRSSVIIRNRIKNAVEMATINSTKPNCLILDEIDGSIGGEETGAVKEIIELLTKKGTRPLARPIICICNDPWARVLFPLRKYAFWLPMPRPTQHKLAQRLKTICFQEGLRTDFSSLFSLCELTNCDIRGCLHVLQFIRSKSTILNPILLHAGVVGRKDARYDLFEIWNMVFRKPKVNTLADARFSTITSQGTGLKLEHSEKIALSVSQSGDEETIIFGLHHNLLDLRLADAGMQKLLGCYEWFSFADELLSAVHRRQAFVLKGYLPFAVLGIHSLSSTTTNARIKLSMPRSDWVQTSHMCQTLSSQLLAGSRPATRISMSPSRVTTELVSPLLQCVAPKVRSVNAQIMNVSEKSRLERAISILFNYGLNFEQTVLRDALQFDYSLSPPIQNLVEYLPGGSVSSVKKLNYATKQTIRIKVQTLVHKSREPVSLPSSTNTSSSTSSTNTTSKSISKAVPSARKREKDIGALISKVQKTSVPAVKKDVIHRDFFGNVVKSPSRSEPLRKLMDRDNIRKARTVLYRFEEGVTNAIRRKVKMRDLL